MGHHLQEAPSAGDTHLCGFTPSSRQVVEKLLDNAGVRINGPNPWDIEVKDERLFDRVLKHKNLGLGEAYMDGWWECRQIDEFICRILKSSLDTTIRGGIKLLIPFLMALVSNRQSKSRSRLIAQRHYDLGNDLFMSFLDPYMQYSCAYFDNTHDLARAQRNKLDLLCRKLHLQPHDRVLDIGCGWGGFAKYAALHYGCSVTAVNISDEQMRVAREFCKDLPIEIVSTDYRELEGTYDKIVSVGMFEHVGYKNYRTFMEVAHRCLKAGGIFLLHTIGGNASHVKCDPWINSYIFPNGMLPSIAQIGHALEGLFVMEDWHNLSPHYDTTLMAWNTNFQDAWPRLAARYGTRFKRMWEYYLLSCAGAFRARTIQLWQIVLSTPGTLHPQCRCRGSQPDVKRID